MFFICSCFEAVAAGQNTKLLSSSADYYANKTAFADVGSYRSIKMSGDGKYIVVANEDEKKIIMSSDYGNTWTVRREGIYTSQYVAISDDGAKIAVAENNGNIYVSVDFGVIWKLTAVIQRYWNGIAMSSNGRRLFLIVESGYIYTSYDFGNNFVERSSMGSFKWSGIATNSDGTSIVATAWYGSRSIIYVSSDSGLTWVALPPLIKYSDVMYNILVSSIAMSNDGSIIAFAAKNIHEFDETYSGDAVGYFYDSLGFYVDGEFRYYEGFSSDAYSEYPNYGINTLAMNGDGTRIVYVSTDGYLYISVDSGVTWFNKDGYSFNYWHSLAISRMGNMAFGIANGDNSDRTYIYTIPADFLMNSYSLITSIEEKTSAGLNKCWCIKLNYDGRKIAVAMFEGEGNMMLSSDSGNTWTVTPIKAYWLAMSAIGTDLAAVEYGGYIYTSSDFGVTWVVRTSAGMRDWNCIAMSADGVKLAATEVVTGGSIFTSSDSGKSWIQRTSSTTSTWYSHIAMSGDGNMLLTIMNQYQYYYERYSLSQHLFSSIYSSLDFGVTWSLVNVRSGDVPLRVSSDIFLIAMSYDGRIVAYSNIYLYSSTSKLYMSYDYGMTVTSRLEAIGSFAMSSDGKKIVAGDSLGYLYTSFDCGITWYTEKNYPYGWISLAMSGDGTKIAARAERSIIYTFSDCPLYVLSTIFAQSPNVSPSYVPSSVAYYNPSSSPTNTDSLSLLPSYTDNPSKLPGTIVPTTSATTANDNSINSALTFCDSCSCPVTHYRFENNVCKSCIYPMQSNKNKLVPDPTGSFLVYEPCSVVGVGIPYAGLVCIITVIVMIVGNGLAAFIGDDISQNTMIAVNFLIYALIPFIDYVTNLAYLLAAQFYNLSILSFFLILFIFAHLFFSWVLYKKHALPKLYLLQMPSVLVFHEYSPMTNTIVTGILSIPFIFVNLPFLLPWLLFGSFLFLTHSLSLPFISNPLFSIWTGETIDKCMVVYYNGRSVSDIDMSLLRNSLFIQIIFQSIPLFILQLINNMILGSWNGLSILCIVISVLNMFVTACRLCYWKSVPK